MSDEPHGLLVIDKPRGITSHDAVAQARRLFGTRSVGHAGTLDPMATGVLVLLFGEACKLSSYLTADDKTYVTRVLFGIGTDSFDADGTETQRIELPSGFPEHEQLDAALAAEQARREQVPPSVSAIHDRGVRAHVRVRRGETLDLPPRAVALHSLRLLDRDGASVCLELTVSKGFYVRALARDLGERLGAPAHLTELRRTASGAFTLADACSWPLAERPALISLASAATRALPKTLLNEDGVRAARQGKVLHGEQARPSKLEAVSAWLGPDGALIALGVSSEDGLHQVVRGFR
ncbi:MAG: tRNA pseudouridine(55) synthase TruB [Myxococcota bacterium]